MDKGIIQRRFVRWSCLLVAAVAGACEVDTGELDGYEPDGSVAVDSTTQSLTSITPEFTWSQGQAAVDLGPANNRFCFLVHVQGHFQGGGEMVRVFEENGRVKLGGSSAQTGVAARARCLPLTSNRPLTVHAEQHWSQGEPKKRLATDDNFTACVLTRVRGHFEGQGEAVEITRESGEWRLGGRSAKTGVAASARCISSVFIAEGTPVDVADCDDERCFFPWGCNPAFCFSNVVDLGTLVAPSEIWGPGQLMACGLGSMSGKFKGGAEQASVYVNSSNRWILETSGRQESIYIASAYCFL